MSKRASTIWKIAGISIGLAGLVWLVFGQTLRHRFVNFDDESYVYANPVVSQGLTLPAIGWAFTHIVSHNWHPLTTISHMIDCQLFDLKPAGHHATNVGLHTLAAILLLIALYQITGTLWRSAFVAALFAIHPLHVESVAWIAERKDALSAVFFMLTIGAYGRYARHPTVSRYILVSIFFALGVMSKPMLVTVPFLLLVLDYWPLQRLENKRETIIKLLVEKIPLLVMSVPVAAITVVIQRHGINSIENLSLPWRIGNAFVTLLIYVRQMLWPTDLAVFYPHLGDKLPLWQIGISIALFVAITAAGLVLRNQQPYLLSGWLWYVGMLVPVIGIIQVGSQAHADRYTYLPQIGLYLAVTWGIADFSLRWPTRQFVLRIIAAIVISFLASRAWVQASYWTDSESLWKHALSVADDNDLAHERLASALLDKDRPDEAIVQAQLAVNLKAGDASAQNDFGVALARRGQPEEALSHFWKAFKIDPNLSRLHYNIANALVAKGDAVQGTVHYQKQLEIDPNFAEAHNNFAILLLQKGQLDEAAGHLARVLQLKPNYGEAHNNLAIVLSQKGRIDEAVAQWEKTLSIDSNNLDAHCNLAWVYATFPDPTIRNGSKAVELAERALQLSNSTDPKIWRLAAAAYAESGRFPEAIKAAQNGMALAEAAGNSDLVRTLERNISRFQERSPLRDTPEGR